MEMMKTSWKSFTRLARRLFTSAIGSHTVSGPAVKSDGPARTEKSTNNSTTAHAELPHNDKPISEPSEDRFGIDPFAQSLARSISNIRAPEGTVVALNGPWGSGKSSAVNLVRHHLKSSVEKGDIVTVNFACWWFRGEDALALAFFRELYAALSPSLGDRFKKLLPKIGSQLLRAGSAVGGLIDLAGPTAGAGKVAGDAMAWVSNLIQADDTVEKLHAELTGVLGGQTKRFLIIIDDIDRLSPDEALLIFRLVKSVGRLPNVLYLLIFDRQLAEKIVAERYPSEGPHYLEKIVQAAFDIPLPRQFDLNQELLQQIHALCGSPKEEGMIRFMNVFYDVIAPEIHTPRDLIRLTNALAVTWPAVGIEVDQADFIAMEMLRLHRPELYRALRTNKERVCGVNRYGRNERDDKVEIEKLLLASEDATDHERLKRALMRLFPRLSSVWTNISYGSDSAEEWSRDRLVCSKEHFDTYFRFSVDDDILPRAEVEQLIAGAGDRDLVKDKFRAAIGTVRKGGRTKAALILEELNLHADKIRDDDVAPLLTALFELADELDVEADVARGFQIGDNQLRIHWLLRRLTLQRFDLPKRSALIVTASENAALSWLVDLARSAYRQRYPNEGDPPKREEECLTTEADANALRQRALDRIRAASQSGELARQSRHLPFLLLMWRELAADDGGEVKAWTAAKIKDDAMIAAFAKAFTSYSWSQSLGFAGLGDTVAKRNIRAEIDALDRLSDVSIFRARVEEVAAKGDIVVSDFLTAWRRREENPREQ
jgi:predicted KAP-like P-loop ATPase